MLGQLGAAAGVGAGRGRGGCPHRRSCLQKVEGPWELRFPVAWPQDCDLKAALSIAAQSHDAGSLALGVDLTAVQAEGQSRSCAGGAWLGMCMATPAGPLPALRGLGTGFSGSKLQSSLETWGNLPGG